MPITSSTSSALVATALSVALALPRQGTASVQDGAKLLEAFPGYRHENDTIAGWVNGTNPCDNETEWYGVKCNEANEVYSVILGSGGWNEPGSIPVYFTKLPASVQVLHLYGILFTETTENCDGLANLNLTQLLLYSLVFFNAQCSWDDLPDLSNLWHLYLYNPGTHFEPCVPWSSFNSGKLGYLGLMGMNLTGTIKLGELPLSVKHVDVSSNNFTSIDWAVPASSNLSTFIAPNNEISQTMTADQLPRGLDVLNLENNPDAVGHLNVTSLPEAFRHMNATVFSESVVLNNTQLCFTGTDDDFNGSEGALFVPRRCNESNPDAPTGNNPTSPTDEHCPIDPPNTPTTGNVPTTGDTPTTPTTGNVPTTGNTPTSTTGTAPTTGNTPTSTTTTTTDGGTPAPPIDGGKATHDDGFNYLYLLPLLLLLLIPSGVLGYMYAKKKNSPHRVMNKEHGQAEQEIELLENVNDDDQERGI